MRLLPQSPEQQRDGIVICELDDGRRVDLSTEEIRMCGLKIVLAAYGHDEPTEPIPIFSYGRQVGTVPADFHPMGFESRSVMYDPRPGDFRMEDGVWIAHRALGPGDIEAIPGFIPLRREGHTMTKLWKPDIVIYHGGGCADGFGAAWACWRRWGDDLIFHEANYGAPPPDVAGKNLLIVDFSYKRPVLEEMGNAAKSIIILDHHETAQEDLADFEHPVFDEHTVLNAQSTISDIDDFGFPTILAVFDMKRSGARMAWEFCHPGIEAPLLVRLIEDRDLWLFCHEQTRPFATWLRAEPFSFERWTTIAEEIERPYGNDIMREAEAMQRFHDEKVREIASFARRAKLGVHEPIIVGCPPMFASEVGNYLLEQHPDAPFAATFYDTAKKRMWSLRSDVSRQPVSTIATGFGGGGHRNAAGFAIERVEDFP